MPVYLFCTLLVLLLTLVSPLVLPTKPPAVQAQSSPLYTWSSGATSPIKRFEAQGLAADGRLYVFGGFYDTALQATARVDAYDPARNSWTRLADMPQALTHAAVAVDGDNIYLIGGYLGNNPGGSVANVWRYSISTNSWSAAPSLPAARGGGAAAVIGRKLYFFGGASRSANNLSSTVDLPEHYVLDLDQGTSWASRAPLPAPRNHLSAVVLDGRIYALGGQLGRFEGSQAQAQVDAYDPATDSWTRARDLPSGRSHVAAFALDGTIVVAGGSVNDGGSGRAITEVVRYDPRTDVWSSLPPLPAKRKTPVGDVIGGRIVIATGGTGDPTDTTWLSSLIASPTSSPTTTPLTSPTASRTATATATEESAPTTTSTATEASAPTVTRTATATATEESVSTATATATPTATATTTSGGTTYLFGAAADTFVDSAQPTTSFGSWNHVLAVGNSGGSSKQAYLRFSVSGLPSGAQVQRATLRLTVFKDSNSGGSFTPLASSGWSETTTWNSRPSVSGTPLATLGAVVLGEVVEVDLTGYVLGNGSYSLAITQPSANNVHVGYATRNHKTPAMHPQLVVVVD
jgi:hypothetical protein